MCVAAKGSKLGLGLHLRSLLVTFIGNDAYYLQTSYFYGRNLLHRYRHC